MSLPADTQVAIEGINEVGLDHYLMKPWDPPEEVLYPVLDDLLAEWRARVRPAFEGIRVRGSELELLEIEEGVRAELQRLNAIPREVLLSPSGKRPYEKVADSSRNRLLFGLATVAACVSVLLYVGLRLALARDTSLLVEHINAALGV